MTEAELARARTDPAYRQKLVAESLELLLGELNKLRGAGTDARRARQLSEGGVLAVQLAELLQQLGSGRGSHA